MGQHEKAAVGLGKKKRAELGLPAMTFIVADDWMDKLGQSFNMWLKLHTFVDRTDAKRDYDKIPMSLEKLYEKLNMSKSKFYRLVKPLWEFGLVEIEEFKESKRGSQKPHNVIVYEYPFHVIERKYKPLEKLRDWKKDYYSAGKTTGERGGRPRTDEMIEADLEMAEVEISDRFKSETVDRFKNETVTVSEMKPNNYTNNSSNVSNSSSNVSKKDLKTDDDDEYIYNAREEEEKLFKNIQDEKYKELHEFTKDHFVYTPKEFNRLVEYLKRETSWNKFDQSDAERAAAIIANNREKISDRIHYFGSTIANEENKRLEAIKVANKAELKKQQQQAERPAPVFYDWLAERE